jgi:lipopolysaccharide export system protein LptA
MRRTRRFFLLGIVVILGVVSGSYYFQKSLQRRQTPPVPEALPLHVNAAGKDWIYTQTDGKKPVVEIRAKNMQQVNEPSRFDLEQVDLRLFHKGGTEFDHVRCARAGFDTAAGTLYSEGEVEITMAVPAEGPPREKLLVIKSSGVTFDSKTGRATTDQPASFTFDRGGGQAVGATYDPTTQELRLHSQVDLRWRGEGPQGKLMKLEAGELTYREEESKVYLSPWSRLTRESLTLEGGDAIVTLENGAIRTVEAQAAHGSDAYPSREIQYQAGHLTMKFRPEGEVEKIVGEKDAKLVAVSKTSRTTVTTDRVDLDFDTSSEDSVLKTALAMGRSVVQSAPVPRAGVQPPETRVLRSEVVLMRMRPGGEEIDSVETQTPGQVEFLPNRPGQRHRYMDGERMWIHYGAENRIESVRAVKVSTRTENEPKKGQTSALPSLTWSQDLSAKFDPQTGQLVRLEQWQEFRYQEGEEKAVADRAVLTERGNLITLTGKARVWDAGGSTAADRIVLDQKAGEYTAEGNVASTRLPEKKAAPSGMLSQDEPLHATAYKMVSTDKNAHVLYEGKAMVWQGANRLEAHQIEIDRKNRMIKAHGNVISQFVDRQKKSNAGKSRLKTGAPSFTVVEAPELVYIEQDRLAHYKGGVVLSRPGMNVKAREIRAFLKEAGKDASSDSGLDYAFADGQVDILEKEDGRERRGTADHAEYYVAEDKVILKGGRPRLVDSVRGVAQGNQLTYFSHSDRLLVDGAETQPAVSRLRRK